MPSWFPLDGTPLYNNPALFDLAHRGYRGDIAWYRAAIGTTPAWVIDLGCGTGRLTLPLADDGHHLIGIDENEAMLDVLRTRIQPHQPIDLIGADARHLDMDVQVDVVLAACNFLGHFTAEDRHRVLQRSAGWLRLGGKLLLDLADAAWHRDHPALHRVVAYRDETGTTYAVSFQQCPPPPDDGLIWNPRCGCCGRSEGAAGPRVGRFAPDLGRGSQKLSGNHENSGLLIR